MLQPSQRNQPTHGGREVAFMGTAVVLQLRNADSRLCGDALKNIALMKRRDASAYRDAFAVEYNLAPQRGVHCS